MTADELKNGVPIVRIFRAKARPGHEQALAEKLAVTSAELVKSKRGLVGYMAGHPGVAAGRDFVFITIWQDFASMKELFGEAWRQSLLPPGYAALLETCSVEHYHLTDRSWRSG